MARPATGTISFRPSGDGGSWRLQFTAYKRRESVSLPVAGGWTRQGAEEELQAILAAVKCGVWRPTARPEVTAQGADPSFREFASEWFSAHRLTLRERSAEDYRWALTNHLLVFFEHHTLSQITTREVDNYRTWQLRRGVLSANTINKTITRLAQVLELAVEYGYLPANPARGQRRRVKATKPRRQWLEPEQIKPLLDATMRGYRGGVLKPDRRARALFATALCGGLRIGELLALTWRDVDLANGRLRVRESKTDAGVREVDLWPELRHELVSYKMSLPAAPAGALVFGTSTGEQDTRQNVLKRLKRAATRANETLPQDVPQIPVPLTNHDLRRSFCSLLYARGEQPDYVMDQMGHADAKLALAIYAKAVKARRTRGHALRLVSVIQGVEWADGAAVAAPAATPALVSAGGRV